MSAPLLEGKSGESSVVIAVRFFTRKGRERRERRRGERRRRPAVGQQRWRRRKVVGFYVSSLVGVTVCDVLGI